MHRLWIWGFCGVLLAACSETGKAPSWTRCIGTPLQDQAGAVAIDRAGNVFVAGYAMNAVLHGAHYDSAGFVAKYDSAGGMLWLRELGGWGDTTPTSLATDADGNVVVAGSTDGAIEGDDPFLLTDDAFVVKYDGDGARVWTRQFGSPSWHHGVGSVAIDAADDVLVAGWARAEIPADGDLDLFVVKYGRDGTLLWTRQDGTATYPVVANGVATDRERNVLVAGWTGGEMDGNVSAGGNDLLVVKYDLDGTKLWTRQLGTSDSDGAFRVATDTTGNVFVAGYTRAALDGNAYAGSDDAIVVKYDGEGTKLWTRQFGGSGIELTTGVANAADGSVYVAGWMGVPGGADVFVVKWDGAGVWQSTRQLGDGAEWVVTDAAGHLFVAGASRGAPDGCTFAGGESDVFVRSYDSAWRGP